jgi:hypothetical protein
VGWDWVHLVLRPLLAYCTSPRWQMMVIVEQLVEWRLAGETEVLGENLPHYHFVHPTWPDQGSNPSRRGVKPVTNRLSYGTAYQYGFSYSACSVCRSNISHFIVSWDFLYLSAYSPAIYMGFGYVSYLWHMLEPVVLHLSTVITIFAELGVGNIKSHQRVYSKYYGTVLSNRGLQ